MLVYIGLIAELGSAIFQCRTHTLPPPEISQSGRWILICRRNYEDIMQRPVTAVVVVIITIIVINRLGHWLVNQHGAQWRGLGDTQRQAGEFILGPSLGTRAKVMTFNRIQSRVVTGLLMGHNTLRRQSLPTRAT